LVWQSLFYLCFELAAGGRLKRTYEVIISRLLKCQVIRLGKNLSLISPARTHRRLIRAAVNPVLTVLHCGLIDMEINCVTGHRLIFWQPL
jgi:hypothetical protein